MVSPSFNKSQHIKYWKTCLNSLLPTDYTSTDSMRVALGFFILSSLDLLGAGADILSAAKRKSIHDWILKCQHPNGGFCGSPTHRYPDNFYDERKSDNADPANLPATFFALLNLNYVGKRKDGSFGEIIKDGRIEGGRDMRYCHFASAVRIILRGDLPSVGGEDYGDIDVDALVRHIRGGETYDGGLGESSAHEAHAGYTYCGIASLSSLSRLPNSLSESSTGLAEAKLTGITNPQATIRWLLSRQLEYEEEKEDEVDEDPSPRPISLAGIIPEEKPLIVGCNGRLNKDADTCYSYYVVGALNILGQGKLINWESNRRFLLEKTQHSIGGFGKQPGYPPDMYHALLGLATLATWNEPGLKELDPILTISREARSKMEKDILEVTAPQACN
ncbi:hypothetical protein FocTR4_00016844 [Fusarium oxysporum f. sp. cubense]|uniref:Prenyltransferase alpha-alpha toroid domain-containing protein n=1 Tax=Fusarium oxysporum f. sp. cubense TaxID=61366 RepID=A0A5C6SGQ5_FUSOC|nr:hypothetical protein FocTR4_00016829 [Fusarium oxysporum f. sp. cubense]TXB97759.1 hypothetical protein FocTR4_00016844 [Fusarium oxysporum f. sp. cubense]